jgi:hypothetical protein
MVIGSDREPPIRPGSAPRLQAIDPARIRLFFAQDDHRALSTGGLAIASSRETGKVAE